jgi:putative ABC transport system permease protein
MGHMNIRSIIFKHIWRNKQRVVGLFFCLVIVITTTTALYHLVEGMNEALGNTFDEIGANIIIIPKQDELDLSYAHLTVEGKRVSLKLSELEKIDQIEYRDYIVYVSPKLIDRVDLNGHGVPLMGIHFENEKNVKITIQLDGEYPAKENEILMGAVVAKEQGVSVGETIIVGDENFHVSGILQKQHDEHDHFVYMDLKKAQGILNRENEISLIEIAAHCHLCPVYEIANQIRLQMTNADVKPLMDVAFAREETLDRFRMFFYVIAIILLFAGSYLLIYFMSSYTTKRRQEIGLLRTIGFENRMIEKILLGEALILGLVGGLLGYVLGIITVFLSIQFWLTDSVVLILDLQNFLIIVGVSFFLMIIAVIGPLRFASTLDPVQALKKL